MFDLSNRRSTNKRRWIERGRKKRYSVYQAETNLQIEDNCKRLCRDFCEKHGIDLQRYLIEHKKFPWQMTWEFIKASHKIWPYSMPPFVPRHFSEERLSAMKNNIEIAERLKLERGL